MTVGKISDIDDDPTILNAAGNAQIIYDGDCIFCANFVRLVALKNTVGPVDLIDARGSDPRIKAYWRAGYDLHEGMLFALDGRIYHGADALTRISLLSIGSTRLNRMVRLIFSNHAVSSVLYPALKFGRNIILVLRGKGKLQQKT